MIEAMRSQFVPLFDKSLDDLGSTLCKVRCGEEGSTYLMILEYIKYRMCTLYRDAYLLLHGKVYPMLTGHIELLDIEAQ